MNNHLLQVIPAQINRILFTWTMVLLAAGGLAAQGFIKNYPQHHTGTGIKSLPDGYQITTTIPAPDEHFAYIRTDGQGNITDTSFVSASRVGDFFISVLGNGDLLAAGYQQADTVVVIRRLSANGTLLWETSFPLGESNEGAVLIDNVWVGGLTATEGLDGGIYLSGYYESETDLTYDAFLLKISGSGAVQWSRILDNQAQFFDDINHYFYLIPGAGDEAFLFDQYDNGTNNNVFDDYNIVTRIDADGAVTNTYTTPPPYLGNPAASRGVTESGLVYMIIADPGPAGYYNQRLRIYNHSGTVAHEVNLSDLFQVALNNDPHFFVQYIIPDTYGNFVLLMTAYWPTGLTNVYAKITTSGQVLWQQQLPQIPPTNLNVVAVKAFTDGSTGFTGRWTDYPGLADAGTGLVFFKIDANGEILVDYLAGNIRVDTNNNCLADSTEAGQANWMLQISNGVDAGWITTGPNGGFTVPADTGAYTCTAISPNYLWEICDNPQVITIPETPGGATYTLDFATQPVYNCPFMQVEILTGYLQAGAENLYKLHYCNTGTALAEDVIITVTPDPLLTIVSTSAPYTIVDGKLQFTAGNVVPGACNDIDIVFAASGDPDVAGESVCVSAHISPDSICAPSGGVWSGAILEVTGICDNDSLRFTVKNIGSGTSSPDLNYIITDDHVIMYQNELPVLLPGGQTIFSVPATGGSWRFMADQEPGLPVDAPVSVPVEGCAVAGIAVSIGWAVQLQNNNGNPFTDTECRVLYQSAFEQSLSCYPTGVPSPNTIPVATPLAYQVHFNAAQGNVPIVIIDSLPQELDIATLRPGASNYPYTWKLEGNGILYLYPNIPAANLTEGNIEFTISPRINLTSGSVIKNHASIYYGMSAPVVTNTVVHTIGQVLTTVGTSENSADNALPSIEIWPNPSQSYAVIQLPFRPQPNQKLLLRNPLGQIVWEKPVNTSSVVLHLSNIPAGWYSLETWQNGTITGSGTMIIR